MAPNTYCSLFLVCYIVYFKYTKKLGPPEFYQTHSKQIKSGKDRKQVWYIHGCVKKWVLGKVQNTWVLPEHLELSCLGVLGVTKWSLLI